MINRVLLWKELRMQRPVLLAGGALALLGPAFVAALMSMESFWDAQHIARGLRTALAAVWPLLGVAAGAITFATEHEDGTARFLLSRPVTRVRVWCIKVGAAAATFAFTGLLAFAMVRLVAGVAGPPPADFIDDPGVGDWTLLVATTVLGLGALLFAAGVLCSTIVRRPLTAAAAAVAVALLVLALAFVFWSMLGLVPQLEPQWLGAETMVLAAILLAASFIVFTWPEQYADGIAFAAGRAGAGGGAALVLVAAIMPLTFAAVNPGVDEMTPVPGSVSFVRGAIAMTMRAADGTTQAWMLMADGSGALPVAGRHTLAPLRMGGANQVAYYARRAFFGTAGETLDLRVIDTNRAFGWRAVADMPGVRELFFDYLSRNGTVAFRDADHLIVARLNGYTRQTIDTAGTPIAGAALLGFNNLRTPDELLFASGDVDVATATLRAPGALLNYALDREAVRELVVLGAGSVLPASLRNPDAGAQSLRGRERWTRSGMPLLAISSEAGAASARLLRVDSVSGETEVAYTIERAWSDAAGRDAFHRCAAVELAPERRWQVEGPPRRTLTEPQLLMGDCSESARDELGEGAIRAIGTRTGNVVSWPLPSGWTGRIQRAFLSLRQSIVLLDVRGDAPGTSYALALHTDGTVHTYPLGWTPLGWLTLDFFVALRETAGTVSFAVGDARTGELFELFPNNEVRDVLRERLEERAAEMRRR